MRGVQGGAAQPGWRRMTGAGAYLGGWVYTPVPFPHPYPSHPCGPGDNGCGGCGWERVRVRVHPYPPAALRPTCRFGLPCEGLRPALKQASSIAGPRRWGRVGCLDRRVNTPMTSGISLQLNFTERTSGQWWSHGGAVAEDLVPSRSRDMMSSATTKCISMGGANCASPVMPTEP